MLWFSNYGKFILSIYYYKVNQVGMCINKITQQSSNNHTMEPTIVYPWQIFWYLQ